MLLAGTALASTLLLGTLFAPTPAHATTDCLSTSPPAPAPIFTSVADSIVCVNTEARNGTAFAIYLQSNAPGGFIDLYNSGALTAVNTASFASGIATYAQQVNSPITIENVASITATSTIQNANGIVATTAIGSTGSPVSVENSGDITADAAGAGFGINVQVNGGASPVSIVNSGDIAATGVTFAVGILGQSVGVGSSVSIVNSGDIATTNQFIITVGIDSNTYSSNAPISIVNSGDIAATSTGGSAFGIRTRTNAVDSGISLVNSGDATATAVYSATGLYARTDGAMDSPLSIVNSGNLTSTAGFQARGILGETRGDNSALSIVNSGNITTSASGATLEPLNGGIFADTFGLNSALSVVNSGNIAASGETNNVFGIFVNTRYDGSPLSLVNSGDISVDAGGGHAFGIDVFTGGMGSPLSVENSGRIRAAGLYSYGIRAQTFGPDSPTTIVNSGDISAASLFAIQVDGGAASIFNTGLITGFVDLTSNPDSFFNQNGGVFAARLTSDFGPGTDLFRNEQGGTVHAVAVGAAQPSFVNLERFENKGLISLVDGEEGDIFQISNTVGGTDLDFVAGSGALAVDAFLGPPGSTADNFIIDGNVTGKTALTINNTNPGPGVFNPDGIPVVFVPNGNVSSDAFFMPQPFDSGLFDWDLYFVPTGSGFFELRSFPGGGAHVLPQLLTAAQDIFHTTNETWFDRTADLRVLLNGGAAYGAGGGKLDGAPVAFTPGVWLKGSGTWLEQEDSAKTSAYGRTYRYNLNRDLDVANFEGGIDFGKKGVWSEGDALVFGVLGGVVLGTLDYDQLIRQFDIEGGEVGGYATYLSGGLFVDTLVKVDFLEFDTQGAPGLPGTLDATTWGFRTDAGYRFGGFRRGPFIEPLATIAVAWSEIDDFSLGGNSVKFDDDANVRGRLGLRVGTSREVWSGIVMEPFVIGSVWGHLSGDNKVTVTSLGTKFGPFTDEPDDVWGVASAGVNFFSPGASTSLFAKLDVTFGEETEGVSAKGGMRYNW